VPVACFFLFCFALYLDEAEATHPTSAWNATKTTRTAIVLFIFVCFLLFSSFCFCVGGMGKEAMPGSVKGQAWGWAGGSLRRRVLRPPCTRSTLGSCWEGEAWQEPHRPTRSDGSRPPAPPGKSSAIGCGVTECPRD